MAESTYQKVTTALGLFDDESEALSHLLAIWSFSCLGARTPNPLGGTRGHPGRPIKTAVSDTPYQQLPRLSTKSNRVIG
jgi:hypothetical protein